MKFPNPVIPILLFATAACADNPAAPPVPTTMVAVSSTSVTGLVNSAVSPPAVRISDQFGNPMQGVAVRFKTAQQFGAPAIRDVLSNSDGIASMTEWRLTRVAGSQSTIVISAGVDSVVFTAIATPDAPASIEVPRGNDQTGFAGHDLATSLTLRVADQFGNGVKGIGVNVAVIRGGGSVSAVSVSDERGELTATWTLGAAGENTATATAVGIQPVTLNAFAVDFEPAEVYEVPHQSRIILGREGEFFTTLFDISGSGTYTVSGDEIIFTYSGNFLKQLEDKYLYYPYDPSLGNAERGIIDQDKITVKRCFLDDCFDSVWSYHLVEH